MTRTIRKVTKTTDVELELKPYWSVRVVRLNGERTYYVEYEKIFEYKPDKEDIADVLIKHRTSHDSFANVCLNYRFVEVEDQKNE